MDDQNNDAFKPWGMELKAYLLLMHLSQLAGFVIPFAGLVVPIVMWATNKDQSDEIDQHGKTILNWMISAFIYFVVSTILVLVVVGLFLYIALGILAIVFAVIGAIKANDGIHWEYPLSIKFFK